MGRSLKEATSGEAGARADLEHDGAAHAAGRGGLRAEQLWPRVPLGLDLSRPVSTTLAIRGGDYIWEIEGDELRDASVTAVRLRSGELWASTLNDAVPAARPESAEATAIRGNACPNGTSLFGRPSRRVRPGSSIATLSALVTAVAAASPSTSMPIPTRNNTTADPKRPWKWTALILMLMILTMIMSGGLISRLLRSSFLPY